MIIKNVAIKAVKEAGVILMNNIHKIKSVGLKQRNDYVTNIDIEVESRIKEIIQSNFPEHHGIVAEESGIEKKDSEYIWFIDPISSTGNYIHGLPHFAVSVAVQKNSEFVLAAVYDPYYDELFYTEKGRGAFLNNKIINISNTDELSRAIICIGIHKKGDAKTKEGLKYFEKIVSTHAEFRRIGSTSLQVCYVACGRIDAHINNHSDIFAIPSGKLILEEAGGVVTDFNNNPWNLSSKTIVASNGKFHKTLIALLK
ncbi:inositol monophosphatase family protein [Patescibacteria group bacterium]